MEKAIQVKDVDVRYGQQTILKDMSFELEKGDFLGVIGPNGGGKTTLLKVILGLVKPDKGEVKIFGTPVSKAGDVVGYVPQRMNFDVQFPISVWEVVLMGRVGGLGLKPFFSEKDKKIASQSLSRVDMLEYKDKQFSMLSGGQQQRVLIARALADRPKILLLDEPTASVDEQIRTNIYELLQRLNKERGITVVLVSHDIGVISSHVNKVACLNKYLVYHGGDELTPEMLEESYGCPVDLIAHGHPHRVFEHKMPSEDD
ncbi:MAG: ABC transporter ATP-binding protein [Candidatus Saliniplasma sp.]